MTLPSSRIRPIDELPILLRLVAGATGESLPTVIARMQAEAQRSGANVMEEVRRRGIKSFEWSPELEQLYRDTNAFIYESIVWNATRLKCRMRDWIGSFAQRFCHSGARVLCYGDGLGFDSVYLARLGYEVTYVEVSEKCRAVAREVASCNDVRLQCISVETDIPVAGFDLVVCLDVLEHVPDPQAVVARFASWLRKPGLLVSNAPFFLLSQSRPTHLKSNLRFSGDWRRLYGSVGFQPVATRPLWDPIAFTLNAAAPPRLYWRDRLAVGLGALVLRGARYWNRPYCAFADRFARADPDWKAALDALASKRDPQ